jgi:cytochrome c-type biogenesis protein CcmE
MTVAPPTQPVLPPRRRPWGILVLVGVVVLVVAWLAFSSVGNALVYYQEPNELLARGEAAVGETVRLGGLVEMGSVEREAPGEAFELRFVLTDGEASIPVVTTNAPTASFREGTGAVVEGALDDDGTFVATQVIVKHDENYEAPPPGGQPSDNSFVPGG